MACGAEGSGIHGTMALIAAIDLEFSSKFFLSFSSMNGFQETLSLLIVSKVEPGSRRARFRIQMTMVLAMTSF